jgi:hypothetical protein
MYILYYVYTPRTDVYNVYDTDMSVAKLMKNHRRDLLFHFLFPTMDVVVFCFYISRYFPRSLQKSTKSVLLLL